ncbi:6-phosphogluconolactonase [Aureispira anguillae]|uniref:6-phosphogluconolactonase n=1 Tax=Aureispira anguillae TaxID=2864201 RepID=A0A915YEW0_9BACT|nr:6-phosphogluconolactonase [Aureispira anguillae]BDS11767.1 6-phosphogluconolactonase [Aureispira anguillae]
MTKNKSFVFTPLNNSQKIDKTNELAVPNTRYFKSKEAFDAAVGRDFIDYANATTSLGQKFLVGLAHGQSPAGAYQYILEHFHEIKRSSLIRFTFTNSRLKRQRGLEGVMDARALLTKMLRKGLITKDQILGRSLDRENIEQYAIGFNTNLRDYLRQNNKVGYDYVFLSFDPTGRVAGISRNSEAFDSNELVIIVDDLGEPELTGTPQFLAKAKRIAFLATKSDKRRPLAWLYYRWGKVNESPSFLRHIDQVRERMTVFIDDHALTWPQIEIVRQTPYGSSTIRLDFAKPYDPNATEKLPVVLLIHGFLGLNSFDSILTALPTHDYIGTAMHYGSIPHDLPPSLYSDHVVKNIDEVISYFGKKGHPVYIFDHSMGNTYFMLMDRDYDQLPGVKHYLYGRIGSNPFFCEHAKHAFVGFLDNVLLPAVSFRQNIGVKTMLMTLRRLVPLDTKKGVRQRGIKLTDWLIRKDSLMREKLWQAVKERILHLMTNLESVPHLDRIPIERALSRLPAKVFAIQVHAALLESKSHDKQKSMPNMAKHNIPILILKSKKDAIAKFSPQLHKTPNITVIDVTNPDEDDLFREHLYHMVNPEKSTRIIIDFIKRAEAKRKA